MEAVSTHRSLNIVNSTKSLRLTLTVESNLPSRKSNPSIISNSSEAIQVLPTKTFWLRLKIRWPCTLATLLVLILSKQSTSWRSSPCQQLPKTTSTTLTACLRGGLCLARLATFIKANGTRKVTRMGVESPSARSGSVSVTGGRMRPTGRCWRSRVMVTCLSAVTTRTERGRAISRSPSRAELWLLSPSIMASRSECANKR